MKLRRTILLIIGISVAVTIAAPSLMIDRDVISTLKKVQIIRNR